MNLSTQRQGAGQRAGEAGLRPRWNFFWGLMDGSIFGIYLVLVDVNLVIPWMLSQLTDSRTIIGLAPTISLVGSALPQLLAVRLVQADPYRKRWVLRFAYLRLLVFLPMVPFLLWDIGGPAVMLGAFLVCYSLSSLTVAFVSLPWMDMMAKVIPHRRLSAFFGLRSFMGGLLGLLAADLVRTYLGAVQTVPFSKFGVILGVGVTLLTVGTSCNAFIREPPGPVYPDPQPLGKQIQQAVRLSWEDHSFRYYLVLRGLLIVSSLTVPLYIVEGRNHYGLLAESVGTFTMASLVASIGASLGWSFLGDRLRISGLLRVVALLAVVPPVLALLMPYLAATPLGALGGWMIVFVVLGAASSGQQNASFRGVMELPKPENRSLMIGFGNTFSGLVSLAGPLIGLLADVATPTAAFVFAAISVGSVILLSGRLGTQRH